MIIAVSGSNGFIGEKIVSKLINDNCELLPIDTSDGIDLTDLTSLDQVKKFDVMVHLAGLSFVPDSFKDPQKFYQINFLTTLNALELCRINGAKMVFISSYVYGKPQYLPIDENHPVVANNPYAQTKIIGEKLCEGYHRDFDVPVIILRPFNIFGRGQNEKFLISTILAQITSGKSEIFLINPNPKRDYIHVCDAVSAIELAVVDKTISFGVFNVCSNSSYSVKEITEIIKSKLKRSIDFTFDLTKDRKSDIEDTRGSYEKIKKELGWEPGYSFEQGITKDMQELELI
jgi:UDP-glucose 4-epimerase